MIRKSLILSIDSYVDESIIIYNPEEVVLKSSYFQIMSVLSTLVEDDFDSKEKHSCFLKFLKHPERNFKRSLIENGFDGDYLHPANFLRMCDFLKGINNWLK